MPLLKLRDLEIQITKNEKEQISNALLSGVAFFRIGGETINSKYVIGVFESNEQEPQRERLIEAPKPGKRNFEKMKEILDRLREDLQKKGIIN